MPKVVLQQNEKHSPHAEPKSLKAIEKLAKIHYSHSTLFSSHPEPENYFFLATDHHQADIIDKNTKAIIKAGEISKKYFAINKNKLDEVKKLLSDNHHLYEIIRENVEVKLYFDLEGLLKDDEDDKINTTNFINAISHILNNDFDIELGDDEIIILNSSRKNKFSNHIIFQSIIFNNLAEEKIFITYLINRFNKPLNEKEAELFEKLFFIEEEKRKCIMDIHPYGRNQCIRCINQSKIYKTFKLLPTKQIDVLDTLTTFKIEYNVLITKKIIEAKTGQMAKPVKQIKQQQTKTEEPKSTTDNFINFDYTLKAGNTLMSSKNLGYADLKTLPLYKQYLYLIPNNGCDYNDFLYVGFAIKKAGGNKEDWRQWAKLSKKYTTGSKIDTFDNFKTEGQTFNIATLKRLAKLSNKDYFNTQDELFKTYFDLDLEDIKIIEEKSEFVSQEGTQDANNILDENKFIILYAYLGRGKTTAIKRLIKEKGYKRFLFISPRVSFSLFISQEFEIDNYTDALLDEDDKNKVFINNSKKLIISVESIQKINIDNNYQCIFLDESEAILAQFSSPTMKAKYLDCYNKLNELIIKAEKVVCADAFLTNRTIKFVKSYEQPITLIKNNTSPIKRDAIRLEMEDLEKQLLQQELKNNKKPYICSSTKTALESLEAGKKFMPELFTNSIIYYGGYKRDDKLFKDTLKNINTSWKDAKFVATTPTNTVGCSYSVKNDFDNVYMMCPVPTCSVRDMFQMMMRVRHIKENKMYFSLPAIKRNTKANRDDIYYLSLENYENYNKEKIQLCIDECNKFIAEDKDNQHILNILVETFKKFDETPKALREILYFNLFEMYVSNTHYEKMYYKFLDKCGYEYEQPIEKAKKSKKEAKKEDKETIEAIENEDNEELINQYNNIKLITSNEIDEYILNEKKMKASAMEKLIKEKYFYKKMIKDDLNIEDEAKHFFSFINPHRKHYLQRAYEEKHAKSYIDMIEKEISDSNKCKEMIKGQMLRLSIIKDFTKILKLNNTFDRETIVKREDVDILIKYVEDNRKKITTSFNFVDRAKQQVEEKDKYRTFYPYIEECLKNWSGCYLVVEKKHSSSKKPILFKLNGIDYFSIMKDSTGGEVDFIE